MESPVIIPELSLTGEAVKLVEWKVPVGTYVEAGDILAVIETEKASFDLPAPKSGYLTEIYVDQGQGALSGEVVALLSESAAPQTEVRESPTGVTSAPSDQSSERTSARDEQRVIAYPAVRRQARELGIDISSVRGTGEGGRITPDDLVRSPATAETASARSAVASTVSASWEVPQTWIERIFALSTARDFLGKDVSAGVLVDAVIAACGRALARHPRFLASENDSPERFPNNARESIDRIDIAYAVAAGDGNLLLPVVRNVDGRTIVDIAAERHALVERVRARTLTPRDVSRAKFTISNLGPFGVERFAALLVPGQVGILALGRVRNELDPESTSQGVTTLVLTGTLTFDHRAVNGHEAAQFLASMDEFLQRPDLLQKQPLEGE